LRATPHDKIYFKPSDKLGHSKFDLRQLTLDRLRASGLEAGMVSDCTYADEGRLVLLSPLYTPQRTRLRTTDLRHHHQGRTLMALQFDREEYAARLSKLTASMRD
jgi:copper oxidase (laccase) domain-containing protein